MHDDDALTQQVGTRALSLARSGVSVQGGATVLMGFSRRRRVALVLARARCVAALDQQPFDAAARGALDLLDLALAAVEQ